MQNSKGMIKKEDFDRLMNYCSDEEIGLDQSLLSSITSLQNKKGMIAEEDFYRDGHKVIYRAILEMFKNDMAVDLLTLLEYLKSAEDLEKAGGVTYITEVSSSVPTTANLSAYIKISPRVTHPRAFSHSFSNSFCA